MMLRLLFLLFLWCALPLQAAPLKVVASFSILGDWARQVGGERVAVTVLAGPNQDLHSWQASPGLAKQLSTADILIVNGLGLDDKVLRLAKASGFKGRAVVATQGLHPLHATEAGGAHDHDHEHGAVDPHAWQDILLAPVYIDNIERAFGAADPGAKSEYRRRAAHYKAQLAQTAAWAQQQFATLKPNQRRALISHDAFAYFARRFGLSLIPVQGKNNEGESGARWVAGLINQIKNSGLKAVFVENTSNSRLTRQIAVETGVQIGGELYSDALSAANGPAADYLRFYRHNVSTLLTGMRRN